MVQKELEYERSGNFVGRTYSEDRKRFIYKNAWVAAIFLWFHRFLMNGVPAAVLCRTSPRIDRPVTEANGILLLFGQVYNSTSRRELNHSLQ